MGVIVFNFFFVFFFGLMLMLNLCMLNFVINVVGYVRLSFGINEIVRSVSSLNVIILRVLFLS